MAEYLFHYQHSKKTCFASFEVYKLMEWHLENDMSFGSGETHLLTKFHEQFVKEDCCGLQHSIFYIRPTVQKEIAPVLNLWHKSKKFHIRSNYNDNNNNNNNNNNSNSNRRRINKTNFTVIRTKKNNRKKNVKTKKKNKMDLDENMLSCFQVFFTFF